jgi:hypothetical protein
MGLYGRNREFKLLSAVSSVLWFALRLFSTLVKLILLVQFFDHTVQDIIALLGGSQWPISIPTLGTFNKLKLSNVLPTLLIQASAWSDSCCDVLSQPYSAHGRGAQEPSDRAMTKCLKKWSPSGRKGLPTSLWMRLTSVRSDFYWSMVQMSMCARIRQEPPPCMH